MAEPDEQQDTLLYIGQVTALSSTNSFAPTLLQSNTYGEISSAAHSGNLSLGILKPATRPHRWFDYDGAIILTGRLQSDHIGGTGYFSQLYAHLRLYIVDITVGIQPFYNGCAAADLTMGNLLFSTNTHPIPQIRIGLDRWTPIPGFFGYVEVKGGLTHGWLDDNNPYVSNTLLHHAYIGGRIGGTFPVALSYEFHHAAQWGGKSAIYGDLGTSWHDFSQVFLGKEGGSSRNETLNAIGNHIAFQQVCLTAQGKKWYVNAYWQAINEDGPVRFIGFGMNPADGLWGLHMHQTAWPFLHSVTMEFIQTTDQSGPWHDRDGFIYGGRDDYYTNSIYRQGWTYFGRTIGSPALSPSNNRVMAAYIGIKGDIYGFNYRLAAQHTRNYGRYTAPVNNRNTALLLDIYKHVEQAWGMDFGLSLGVDFGSQYGTQFGALITIRKQGLIKTF